MCHFKVVLSCFGLKTGMALAHYSLKSGMVLKGTTYK